MLLLRPPFNNGLPDLFSYPNGTPNMTVRSTALLRVATVIALTGYPIGCVIRLNGANATGSEIAGFACIVASLVAFCVTIPSSPLNVYAKRTPLNDVEINLRRKSYTASYAVVMCTAILGALYMGIATDSQDSDFVRLWLPQTFDDWSAIFWGLILYTVVIPTAYLTWAGSAPPEDGDEYAAEAQGS